MKVPGIVAVYIHYTLSSLIGQAINTVLCSGIARHGPSSARPDLLATYHAYLIPFHEVLFNRSIELEPCSLRWITVPGSPANLTKQGLLVVRSTKVPQEPILVTEKWRRNSFFFFLCFALNDRHYAPINFGSIQSLSRATHHWEYDRPSLSPFYFSEKIFSSSSYTVCKWRSSPTQS